MNDIIIIEFPPEQEGITWVTREIKEKHVEIKNHETIRNFDTESLCKKKTYQMTNEFKSYLSEVNLRLEKYSSSHSEQVLKQLKDDYKTICVNLGRFGTPLEMVNCIRKINTILYRTTNHLEMIKNEDIQRGIGMSDRGIQIQERLSEIKFLLKKPLSSNELYDIKNELLIFKNELNDNESIFSKADNISVKLFQIENYLNKISKRTPANCDSQAKEEIFIHNNYENNQNGQTQRGKEIQEELANLRDEVKRKDLNPIEKENLTNALLKLQKEINSNIVNFSKFDIIPVRLNQIENYLEKLKNKEDIKQKQVRVNQNNNSQKENTSEPQKNKKKQIIWRFGL